MNHEVLCGNDREIFVTKIESSLEFDFFTWTMKLKLLKVRGGPQASNHFKQARLFFLFVVN